MSLVEHSQWTSSIWRTQWSSPSGQSRNRLPTQSAVSSYYYSLGFDSDILSVNDNFYRGKNTQEWSEDSVSGNLSDHEDEAAPNNVKLETRYSPTTVSTINLLDERVIPFDLIVRLLEHICFLRAYAKYSTAILVFLPGIGEIRRLNDFLVEHADFGSSDAFVIYHLHSSISSENQGAVFEVPPPGIRKIVLGR
jgi:ATP-dependent RNA helicase DHX29